MAKRSVLAESSSELSEIAGRMEEQPGAFVIEVPGTSGRVGSLLFTIVDVQEEKVEWLWPGKLPIGKLSLLVGDPGRGKSLLSLDLAARLSAGRPWPDGQVNLRRPSSTILVSAEDDIADTIRPRLEAAAGDLCFVHALQGSRFMGMNRGFALPRDLDVLRAAVEQTPDVKLVVLDPLMAFLPSGTSTSNSALRTVAASLQDMAAELNFAVLAITHLTKSPAASPLYRAMGSLSLVAAARAVWTLWPDQDDARRTFFIPLKCNLSEALHALAYSLADSPVKPGYPCINWEPEAIPLALVPTSTANPVPRIRDQQCIAWLKKVLSQGAVPSKDLDHAAECEGFGRNVLRRAKAALGVNSYVEGVGSPWLCSLPNTGR